MNQVIEHIKELETLFSDNQYDGRGKYPFFIEEGNIPVMVSAPHAINQFREGKVKWADQYTGGIARYLHEATGCHLICASLFNETDPNYDSIGHNAYQDALKKYVEAHNIRFLLDLHGAAKSREYALEMGTAPEQDPIPDVEYEIDPSLHKYKFVADLVKNIFEELFKDSSVEQKEVWKNQIFNAGDQNTVTKYISENTKTACVQLEINANYRNPENRTEFDKLIIGLIDLIEKLSRINEG